MGQIIEARFEELMPSKPSIRLDNLYGMLMREKSGIPGLLAPFRKSEDREGIYTSLDGNSRMVRLMMENLQSAKIYLAESDEDTMCYSIFPDATDNALFRSNYSIHERWVQCERDAEEIMNEFDIKNYREYFNKLLINHPYLRSTSDFWEYITTTEGRKNFKIPIGGRLNLRIAS